MAEAGYLSNDCPHCGGGIEFPEHGVGEWIDCPHCGKQVQLRAEGAQEVRKREIKIDGGGGRSHRLAVVSTVILVFIGAAVLGIRYARHAGGANSAKELAATHEFVRLKALAEKGDAEAQYKVGLMVEDGNGNTEQPPNYWFEKAAEQGNLKAQKKLLGSPYFDQAPQEIALSYAFGRYPEGLKWCFKAANQGDPEAEFILGAMFEQKFGHMYDPVGVTNLAEAIKWYRKAAGQGYVGAEEPLGQVYDCLAGWEWMEANERSGKPVPPTDAAKAAWAQAATWYRKSADRGDAGAQCSLGTCYKLGHGVPEDAKEAAKWDRRAAEQGYWPAQGALGAAYAEGKGVPQNYVEAYKWLNLAAASGKSGWDEKQRAELEQRMLPEQIAEGQRRSGSFVPKKEIHGAAGGVPSEQSPLVATAFFITEDGYALTAYHAVGSGEHISLRMAEGTYPAMLVKSDKANDLALLKASGAFHVLPVQPSGEVQIGESVMTIGFPNVSLQGIEPKLTEGRVSSLSGAADDPRYFQVSAQVQPGNSGGALVNIRGNVVGVVAARLDDLVTLSQSGTLPQNVNYAVKSSYALLLLESMPDVSAKLKKPQTKERKVEDVAKQVQQATAMVVAY